MKPITAALALCLLAGMAGAQQVLTIPIGQPRPEWITIRLSDGRECSLLHDPVPTVEVPLPQLGDGSGLVKGGNLFTAHSLCDDGCSKPQPIDVPAVMVPHKVSRLKDNCYLSPGCTEEVMEYLPKCLDLDRIPIGPDGYGKYWCHLPQTGEQHER